MMIEGSLIGTVASRAQAFLKKDVRLIGPVSLSAPALTVLVLALAVNALHVLGGTPMYFGDSGTYLVNAYRIFFDGEFRLGLTRVPGYSIFLAPIVGLFGAHAITVMVLVQHMLAALVSLLVVMIGDVLDPRRALGFLAGLLSAFSMQLQSYASLVMSEVLFTFIMTLGFLFALRYLKEDGLRPFLLAVFLFSLAAMVRPVGMYFGFMLMAVPALRWAFPQWRAIAASLNQGNRRPGVALAAGAIIYAAVVVPWMAHNYTQHGYFGLVGNLGQNLFSNTVEYGDFWDADSPAIKDIQRRWEEWEAVRIARGEAPETKYTWRNHWPSTAHYLGATGSSLWQADKVYMQAALDSIKAHPAAFAKHLLRNTYRMVTLPVIAHRYVPGLAKDRYPPDFMPWALPVENLEHFRAKHTKALADFGYGEKSELRFWEPTALTPLFGAVNSLYYSIISHKKAFLFLFFVGLGVATLLAIRHGAVWWGLVAYIGYHVFLPPLVVPASARHRLVADPMIDILYVLAIAAFVTVAIRALRWVDSRLK